MVIPLLVASWDGRWIVSFLPYLEHHTALCYRIPSFLSPYHTPMTWFFFSAWRSIRKKCKKFHCTYINPREREYQQQSLGKWNLFHSLKFGGTFLGYTHRLQENIIQQKVPELAFELVGRLTNRNANERLQKWQRCLHQHKMCFKNLLKPNSKQYISEVSSYSPFFIAIASRFLSSFQICC